MLDPISFPEPLQVLQKSLDSTAIRHQAIANNLANIDTPNFKRTEVSFQEQLKAVLDKNKDLAPLVRTHPRHFPVPEPLSLQDFKPQMRTITETLGRNDGNNVDLDMETSKLAENTLLYNSLADVTARYLGGLRRVISEGRQ